MQLSIKNSSAVVRLHADSGFRYTFATVQFDSDFFDDVFLQRFVPFEAGDFYESSLLAQLTQQLQSTGYFSRVRVVPQYGAAFGKQVPINVELVQKDKNQVGIGLGFATDTEWRTRWTWDQASDQPCRALVRIRAGPVNGRAGCFVSIPYATQQKPIDQFLVGRIWLAEYRGGRLREHAERAESATQPVDRQ